MSLELEYLQERVINQDALIEDFKIEIRRLRSLILDGQRDLQDALTLLKEYQDLCQKHRLVPPLTTGNTPETPTTPPPPSSRKT